MTQNLIAFVSKDGAANIDVHLQGETIWLSLKELAQLFERDKSVISRHIKKIFTDQELDRESVVAFFATTAEDGKTYQVESFNLDLIISLGYRVNSKRAIEFRQWATKILKDYLVQGYSLSQWQLGRTGVKDLSRALELLSKTLESNNLVSADIGIASLEIISQFARSWSLLLAYDEFSFPKAGTEEALEFSLKYQDVLTCVELLKGKLIEAGEASALFGLEREGILEGILGSIEQTFAGQALYKSARERAAHLLYFIIKDHPFSDGNKRIGAFLFLVYLKVLGIPSLKITDSTLVAMALMIAESNPQDKELMIALIVNLI